MNIYADEDDVYDPDGDINVFIEARTLEGIKGGASEYAPQSAA